MTYQKLVKELMIPISSYPTVSSEGLLLDAIVALEKKQLLRPYNIEPYRAVLVTDEKGRIVGKIGQLAFLKALEPKYQMVVDMEKLAMANLSSEFINTIMDHYDLWRDNFFDICSKAHNIKVKDIMLPVEQSIDENSSVAEAIHKIIMWQTLSILVSRDKEIVGIIRLSDLYQEIAQFVTNVCECAQNQKE